MALYCKPEPSSAAESTKKLITDGVTPDREDSPLLIGLNAPDQVES